MDLISGTAVPGGQEWEGGYKRSNVNEDWKKQMTWVGAMWELSDSGTRTWLMFPRGKCGVG